MKTSPQINDHIKCVMRNNMIIEGIVESWSEQHATLKSIDGTGVFIIQDTTADIMVIKVMRDVVPPMPQQQISHKIKEVKFDVEENLKREAAEQPSDDPLRTKKLSELKKLLDQQEKKIIAGKLTDHNISEVKKANYEYPGFFKKQSSE